MSSQGGYGFLARKLDKLKKNVKTHTHFARHVPHNTAVEYAVVGSNLTVSINS